MCKIYSMGKQNLNGSSHFTHVAHCQEGCFCVSEKRPLQYTQQTLNSLPTICLQCFRALTSSHGHTFCPQSPLLPLSGFLCSTQVSNTSILDLQFFSLKPPRSSKHFSHFPFTLPREESFNRMRFHRVKTNMEVKSEC